MFLEGFLSFASMIAMSPADEGGAGAAVGDGDAGQAGEGSAQAGQTALTSGSQGDSAGGAADDGAGDGTAKQADDTGKGDNTEPGSADFTIDVPEGMDSFKGDFEAYQGAAAEFLQANPDASAADALKWAADYQAKLVGDGVANTQAQYEEQIGKWEGEAKADPEIGGDKYNENVAVAIKAVEAFGTPAFKDVLNESGLGAHPEMIRFAFKAGQALKDAPVLTTAGGGARKSLTDALYGGQK